MGDMEIAAISGVRGAGGAPEETGQRLNREQVARQRELIQAVRGLDLEATFGAAKELTFVFDRATRRALVRIVDRETKEVVLQIPAEEVLRMAAARNSG